MKKILFIVNTGVISPNENGGASVYYSHLELLFKSGFQIQLLVIEWPGSTLYKEENYVEVKSMVEKIIPFNAYSQSPDTGVKRFLKALFSPETFEYYFLNKKNKKYLTNLVIANSIDVVWSEWRWAGLYAWYSKLSVPVIYAHHDWEYKLAKLRGKRSLLGKFHTFQKKRVEYKLVKGVDGCVSGSITESNEISQISKKESLYVPTTYKNIISQLPTNYSPNIIHLGGMGTTANRLGLERFLDVCWIDVKKNQPNIKLLVIGSLKQASETLLEKLEDSNINCLGFVKDLSEVLHPQDIHIIPWEYNTGTRTRLPLVLNYEQVLVATKESVKAFPEIKNNQNALLCNTLDEMTQNILNLIQNPNRIKELSKAGKETFFNKFTVDSQLEKVKKYLDRI
jgi:glycosyltransferase involved in cell wall biosynthesis